MGTTPTPMLGMGKLRPTQGGRKEGAFLSCTKVLSGPAAAPTFQTYLLHAHHTPEFPCFWSHLH